MKNQKETPTTSYSSGTLPQKSSKESQLESQELQSFLIKAAQSNLSTFSELTIPNYESAWFHEVIARHLEDAVECAIKKKKKRIILAIPPRHGKTQLASIAFPAWALGKYPHLKFILSTYGAELSEDIGQKARDLITSDAYRGVFNNLSLRKDTRAKAKWFVETDEKQNTYGGFTAVGVGGAVTGKGADIIIIDDPIKDRADAESETVRKNVWDYYRSTLYSRLEGHGVIIVIMQRWKEDDLVGLLLEEEKRRESSGEQPEGWEVISFPAIAEQDEAPYRKEGDALWPEKYPLEKLEAIRTNSPYFWASQYMQNPIGKDTQEFHQKDFRYYDYDDEKYKQIIFGGNCRFFTLVDLAISQSKDADNTVVLTIAIDRTNNNIYRIREAAGKYDPSKTIDIVFQHQAEFRSEVWVETVAFQAAMKFSILERQRKVGQFFTVHELKARSAKVSRVRGLIPLYQAGIIYHKKENGKIQDQAYEYELLTFPNGKHDDRIDAMAYLQQALEHVVQSSKAKQFKQKFTSYFTRK